ncbi:MAG TPA: rhomboid family intramembrane serine protease [Bacteroidota bacterium]|nr:rhomboid family intramembrane serine protease [Bacteroidota bacterium]
MLTLALIALNVIVSVLGFASFRDPQRGEKFLFVPASVAAGENFTGMFLSHFSHADIGHLLFNMMTLFFFAPVVEMGLGMGGLLLVYVIAGVSATLLTYVFHKNNPNYRALGASGSVAGVIFAAIVIQPAMSIYFFFVPVPIPGPIFALGYVAISIYLAKRQVGNIGHEAHIGGAVAGFLLAGILFNEGFGPLVERVREFVR